MRLTTAVCAVAASAGLAQAQTLLQIDINALSAQASPAAFNVNYTGTLNVFASPANPDFDGDASILDVLIDGMPQNTGGAAPGTFAFEMTIDFVNGDITQGSLMVAHDQNGSENVYNASLAPTAGGAILDIGNGFVIGGLTFDGMWNSPAGSFLGVDISTWGSAQPLMGYFANIQYQPNANGIDSDVDVDVFQVPTPGALALLSLGGLAATRRRR